METKNILRKAALTALLAFGATIAVNAQSTAYGVHEHEHGIDNDVAHAYMKHYFGYKPTTEGGIDYDNVKTNLITPDSVSNGEVLLVEVNPYWRGAYMYPTDKDTNNYKKTAVGASLWQEVKYGVKAVHKVGAPTNTANGYIYSYTGKLGRFYFAKKRKTASEYWNNTDGNYYRLLGRWYDEWSFLPTNEGDDWGWATFASKNWYNDFVNGAVWYAPHNCFNSLDKNHFASFIADGDEDNSEGYDATVLFYISDYWDSNDVRGNGKGATRNQPFICLLASEQQEPTILANPDGTYDIQVTFNSTFKTMTEAIAKETTSGGKKGEKMWDTTKGGVREFYEIWRTYTDKDGVVHREFVDKVAAPLTTDENGNYVYLDTNKDENGISQHFKSDKEDGTDYTYEIISEIYPVDKDGNIIKTGEEGEEVPVAPISNAKAPDKTGHVPGEDSFYLSIDGSTTCTFVPSTTCGLGENHFNHVINISVDQLKDFDIKEGDYLQLVQTIGSTSNVIKESDKLTGAQVGKMISTIVGVAPWKTVTYPFVMKGGESQDAYYKLVLMRKNSETGEYGVGAFSNNLYLDSYRANAKKGEFNHRSGHPGTIDTSTTETYHNEVEFTPSTDGNIQYYTIICNGNTSEKAVVTSTLYEGGKPYVQAMLHNDVIVNSSEGKNAEGAPEVTPVKMFYTVIATDKKENTYGSPDVEFVFNGTPDELVYSAEANATTSDITREDNTLELTFTYTVNPGAGSAAADVDPSLISSVGIYGDFKVETSTQEKSACSFENFGEGNSLSFHKTINVEEEYPDTYWALIEGAQDEQARKAAWVATAEDLWNKFVPLNGYIGITYTKPTPQPTPTPELRAGLKRAEGAPSAPAVGNTYTKYSNWAVIEQPEFNKIVSGIDNVNVDKVVVYPNPATDQITFNALGTVDIYNLAGARVITAVANGTTTLDVSSLPAGVYLLRTGNETQKFVVTK